MSKYSTQQRKALLHYLSEHPDEHLSTRQIAQALAAEKISLSAVYRNLAAARSRGEGAPLCQTRHTRGILSIHRCRAVQGRAAHDLHPMRTDLSPVRANCRMAHRAAGRTRGFFAGLRPTPMLYRRCARSCRKENRYHVIRREGHDHDKAALFCDAPAGGACWPAAMLCPLQSIIAVRGRPRLLRRRTAPSAARSASAKTC